MPSASWHYTDSAQLAQLSANNNITNIIIDLEGLRMKTNKMPNLAETKFGQNVRIGEGVRFYGRVEIEDDVYIGDYSIIGYYSDDYDTIKLPDQEKIQKTIIRKKSYIRPYSIIGHGTHLAYKCWLDFRTTIGFHTKICQKVEFWYGAQIHNRVYIGENSIIGGFICNDSKIGASVRCLGSLVHSYARENRKHPSPAPTICDGTTIGRGAIVIGNITVGSDAYVAAGAIVTHNVDSNICVAGNPAIEIGKAPVPYIEE